MSPLSGLIGCLTIICCITQIVGQPVNTTSGLGSNATDFFSSIESDLQSLTVEAAPSTIEEAFSRLSSIFDGKELTIFETAAQLISLGLSSLDWDGVQNYIEGLVSGLASSSNVNSREPVNAVYPKASTDDAPYSFTENELRGAIYIPQTFRYGVSDAPQPILLVGGTGNPGYVTFIGTYIPLLQNVETSFGDPVWLNIPGYELEDLQRNAEYVAYAINYLSSICGNRSIAVVGYSQGNLDSQWACKLYAGCYASRTKHLLTTRYWQTSIGLPLERM